MPGLLSVALILVGVASAAPEPCPSPAAISPAARQPGWTLQVAQADDSLGSLSSLQQPDTTPKKTHPAAAKPKRKPVRSEPVRHVHRVVQARVAPPRVAARVVPPRITPPPYTPPVMVGSVTAMPVTIAMPDGVVDAKYLQLASSLPQAPVMINPATLQNVLNGSLPAPPDSPLAAQVREIYRRVVAARTADAPTWKDGIVPTIWFGQTKRATGDWWQSFKATPAVMRSSLVEMLPFAYDFDTDTPSSARAEARSYNDQALDALFIDGDTNRAATLLSQAVRADSAYAYGPYNAGVLMMCMHDQPEAVKMFALFDARRSQATPSMQTAEGAFERNMRSPYYAPNGSDDQKRHASYDEAISAAWALFNVGQWRAAALFAGRAAAIVEASPRPEAPLIAAMICADANEAGQAADWLSDALANTSDDGARNVLVATIADVKKSVAGTAPQPAPTQPIAQTPVAPPSATPTAQPASTTPLPPAADTTAPSADPGAASGNPADPGAATGTQ